MRTAVLFPLVALRTALLVRFNVVTTVVFRGWARWCYLAVVAVVTRLLRVVALLGVLPAELF